MTKQELEDRVAFLEYKEKMYIEGMNKSREAYNDLYEKYCKMWSELSAAKVKAINAVDDLNYANRTIAEYKQLNKLLKKILKRTK